MPGSEECKSSDRKQPPFVLFIIPLMIGLFAFYRVTQSAHFASYRNMDVVQLLIAGAGFSAALTGLLIFLLRSRT